jgi:hypothetical protein
VRGEFDITPSVLFFFLTCILGCLIGRRIGWRLSKSLLYPGPPVLVTMYLLVWGSGTAILLRIAIDWLNPGTVLKVLGYGAGAYVSNPAYGLFQKDSIPASQKDRDSLVNNLPFVVYILAAILLAIVAK